MWRLAHPHPLGDVVPEALVGGRRSWGHGCILALPGECWCGMWQGVAFVDWTSPPVPLAIRAVFSFTGFPGVPEHLTLHHDGYPTGAAWRFAAAQREAADAFGFLSAFLSTHNQAELLAGPEEAADAEYRYWVLLLHGVDPRLVVQAWRRIPGTGSWMPRCGPVPLAVFIQRFLPGDQL